MHACLKGLKYSQSMYSKKQEVKLLALQNNMGFVAKAD